MLLGLLLVFPILFCTAVAHFGSHASVCFVAHGQGSGEICRRLATLLKTSNGDLLEWGVPNRHFVLNAQSIPQKSFQPWVDQNRHHYLKLIKRCWRTFFKQKNWTQVSNAACKTIWLGPISVVPRGLWTISFVVSARYPSKIGVWSVGVQWWVFLFTTFSSKSLPSYWLTGLSLFLLSLCLL